MNNTSITRARIDLSNQLPKIDRVELLKKFETLFPEIIDETKRRIIIELLFLGFINENYWVSDNESIYNDWKEIFPRLRIRLCRVMYLIDSERSEFIDMARKVIDQDNQGGNQWMVYVSEVYNLAHFKMSPYPDEPDHHYGMIATDEKRVFLGVVVPLEVGLIKK